MPFKKWKNPVMAWFFVLGMEQLLNTLFTDRPGGEAKMDHPHNKSIFFGGENILLFCMGFTSSFVEFIKPITESGIRKINIASCLFYVDLEAILLLMGKIEAVFCETQFNCIRMMCL
jgi:hypothetical protein